MVTSEYFTDSYTDITQRWSWRDVLHAHHVMEARNKIRLINQKEREK